MSLLLTDTDLTQLCQSLKIPLQFIGFKDTFASHTPHEGAYIVNLDSKTTGRGGTHWTAFLLLHGKAMYFDPFGLTIPRATRDFILRYKPSNVYFSTNQIQGLDSEFCGYFCLYFLYFFTVQHKRNPHLRYLINKHNSIYVQTNRALNDKIIQTLIRRITKVGTRTRS